MQLGLTWPLQRHLRVSVPYGAPPERGFCWDAHCITLHGRSSLLLVHCESRYTCVRFDMSRFDWKRISEIAAEEIQLGLLEAGIEAERVEQYLLDAGSIELTRTHGRREVAFLNRAWEDVLSADWLVDQNAQHQTLLCRAVNGRLCHAAGANEYGTAQEHLLCYFEGRK